MEAEIISNAGKLSGAVSNIWEFLTFLVIIALVMFILWWRDIKVKQQTDKETGERIKKRDEEHLKRDHRIEELERTMSGLGKSFDRMNGRIEAITAAVNSIDKSMAVMAAQHDFENKAKDSK